MSLNHRGYPVISRGGERFGRYLKSKALKLVQVRTRDFDIDLGLLLREDRRSLNVGLYTRVAPSHGQAHGEERHARADSVFRSKPEWIVLKIPREALLSCRELGAQAGTTSRSLPDPQGHATSPLGELGYTKREGRMEVVNIAT